MGDGANVRDVWKRAGTELFTRIARDTGLGRGPRGVVLRGTDAWAAVVGFPSIASTGAELKLSFELRVWVRWVSEFEAWRCSGWPAFPPTRAWQQRTESAAFSTRWDDRELFPGARVPQFVAVRDGADVAALVARLEEKLADLRPRLEAMAEPRWLLRRWTAQLDVPAGWPVDEVALQAAALTAHGLDDGPLRDRALARLDVSEFPWFAADVRRWIGARPA